MTYPCVLCLGEILFDCLADQQGRSLVDVKSWTPYPGGAPANVACALVKLGTSAGFIGCIGEDSSGDILLNLLQSVGVDSSGVERHPQAPTRKVYVLRSEAGDRTFAGFGNLDPGAFADTHLEAAHLRADLFENADFLVLGTLELAYPNSQKAIAQALDLANRYHLKILVDVNWRPMFWPNPDLAKELIYEILKNVDFVKLSEEEAEWLFDTTDPGAINACLDQAEGIIVTGGEYGCAYCISENEGRLPAFAIPVADTTGSGDSFVAGFVHQVCQQGIRRLGDLETARYVMTYASAVGAMTAMKLGAIASQPTAAEVEAFLKARQLG